MLEILSYILFFGFIIFIIIYSYIKIKYGFWVMQPVFHIYDIGYMLNAPGIIHDTLPEKNKYTNFKNIDTIVFSDISNLQMQRFVNLIRGNYLQNKDNIFTPQRENIISYLSGHNDKSFISFYNEDYHIIESKSGNTITDKKVIGVMTSRPLNIYINNSDKNADFKAYYVDYLCVDKLHRKKGVAPQLIQTHHYNQRHLNKNIVVSLFKREDELTGIVPLCVYTTYGFPVTTWTKPNDLSGEYKLLEINAQNFHFLFSFIRENQDKFGIVINPEVTNIIELIKTKNIFIYALLVDDSIICAYFFRKSCVQIEKGMEVLSCFASINNTDDNIFIKGFKISFWKIAAENSFGFSAIEEISDNYTIIENLIQKTKPLIKSPTAYFFYNFAYPTFKSNKVFIIN
jgi:ribosomal protein S18 acetylase RimI-like enzyme